MDPRALPPRARRRPRPTSTGAFAKGPHAEFIRRRVLPALVLGCRLGLAVAYSGDSEDAGYDDYVHYSVRDGGEAGRHCQKSGCRSSPDAPETDVGKFVVEVHRQKSGLELLSSLIGWIVAFAALWLLLFVSKHGWRPVRRKMCSMRKASAAVVRDAVDRVRHSISRIPAEEVRAHTSVRRGSSHSAISLGSLADLIGFDDGDLESGTGGSAHTSYCSNSESENDATHSTKSTVKRTARASAIPSDSSTAAVASGFTATKEHSNYKDHSSESVSSLLDQFVEFLTFAPKRQKVKEEDAPPRFGRRGHAGHTLERPPMQGGGKRRSTVDAGKRTIETELLLSAVRQRERSDSSANNSSDAMPHRSEVEGIGIGRRPRTPAEMCSLAMSVTDSMTVVNLNSVASPTA